MRFFVTALAVLVVLQSASAANITVAPRYTINLETDPAERWVEIAADFHSRGAYEPLLEYLDGWIPPSIQKIIAPIIAKIDPLLPAPYSQELIGVAKATNMSLGKVVAMNLIYDLTAGCTSILAQEKNGSILHARNLDYGGMPLRQLVAQIDYKRDGKLLYTCTTFVGYVGCLTGMRPGGFSITVDERDHPGSVLDNLYMMLHGGQSIGFFLRSTLESNQSFAEAHKTLESTPLIAPVYIISGGINAGEGVIITRNRSATDSNTWNVPKPASDDDYWILETNFDHWLAPGDGRRDAANKAMQAIGGQDNLSTQALFNVLSTPPVLNSGTKHTTIMHAATGFVQTYIRWDAPADVPDSFHDSRRFW